ncbi:hypothetical protein [Sphingobium sp. Ant17]|jgi:hypothetical protein|uniref:hypothetical protein n=1 Tax=Sphingobium sp. Ant17 TaxID=1461752 RepID=UPI0004AD1BB9|nr:hypothetical protein [Sphingobium sp. Ant17]
MPAFICPFPRPDAFGVNAIARSSSAHSREEALFLLTIFYPLLVQPARSEEYRVDPLN